MTGTQSELRLLRLAGKMLPSGCKQDRWQNLRRRPFVIIIVVMHELASAFLIANRMLLVDKVKIVALGAVDGYRVAPREHCVTYIFSEGEGPVGQQT